QEELMKLVDELNARKDVHGILVQMPLPKHLDPTPVLLAIDPNKDVDGFHPMNLGRVVVGNALLPSCTPAGCIELIKRSAARMEGAHAVVIGRSNTVGKPVALLLLSENCTVTIAHSKTRDLPAICRQADILVAAVGRDRMVKGDWVKEGVTVIDVGMNRTDEGLFGDVDFDEVKEKARAITPVPGGVGPMTIAMLMRNTLKAAEMTL
ncbi:MAG: bifunctional 5,10-methylenetetrahydrofolate dehydrogenase/5,10-methenyltetrahydrofolate cyclohydrolase, partial [Thermoleophilia bacterium]